MLFPIAILFLHNVTRFPEIALAHTEINLRHVKSRNCLEIIDLDLQYSGYVSGDSSKIIMTISPGYGACPVGSNDRLELPEPGKLPPGSIRKSSETNTTLFLSLPEMCLGISNTGDLDSIPCGKGIPTLISFGTVNVTSATNKTIFLVQNFHSKNCIRLDEQGVSPFIRDVPCDEEDGLQHFTFTYAFRYLEVRGKK